MGNDEMAISDYTAAIEIVPEHSFAFLHRGRAKMRRDDWDGAISDFSLAMQFDEHSPLSGLLNRGRAKRMICDFEGAIKDFDQAFDLELGSPIYAPLERARVRASMGDWEGAIQDFSLALIGFPELSNPFRERAEAQRQIGDVVAAELDEAEYKRLGGKDLPAYH